MHPTPSSPEHIRLTVREGYGRIARGEASSCCGPSSGPSSCCSGDSQIDATTLARVVGYSAEELAALPDGVNLGLSCGNPLAIAALRPGETVLDLGSGAGFDIFLAGPRVGAAGRAIGVDMTPDMLSKARAAITAYRERSGLDNVEFRLGEIEHLPVADASVDVIVSNCVVNLSPDKPQVWREVARVLRPGGRVSISDMALLEPLPPAVLGNIEALVGCIAGAALVEETLGWMREAGFADARAEVRNAYVDQLVGSDDPLFREILAQLPAGRTPGEYVASVEFTATRPARG